MQKAQKLNNGADVKVAKANVRTIAQKGGSLWSLIMPASAKLLPKVLPMASSAVSMVSPGLATGALTSLGSFGMA